MITLIRRHAAVLTLFAFASLFAGAVIAFPVLPTCDGPTHVYNAMVAAAVRLNHEPFASRHIVRQGLRSQCLEDVLLGPLGKSVGWENGERIFFLALLLTGLVTFRLLASQCPSPLSVAGVTVAAWFANNWFVWMGFYNFAFSIIVFVLLAHTLERSLSVRALVLAEILLVLAFFAHVFTFAVGTGLVGWVLWRKTIMERKARFSEWAILIVPALMLGRELIAGPAMMENTIAWVGGWKGLAKRIAGLAAADSLTTTTWLSVPVGFALMMLLWTAIYAWWRNRQTLSAVESFGGLLLAASVIAPDLVGIGVFVPPRLRILGTLLLLPAVFRQVVLLPRYMRRLSVAALAFALIGQLAWNIHLSRRTGEALDEMCQLVRRCQPSAGTWISSRFADEQYGAVRIDILKHLTDRLCLRLNLTSLDNFEGGTRTFEVLWRRDPDRLQITPVGDTWHLRLEPRARAWNAPVLLLHDRDRLVVSDDVRVRATQTVQGDQFAVTVCERLDAPAISAKF